jgi:DNA polymerase III subunit beta
LPGEQSFSSQRFLLPKKSVQEIVRLLQSVNDEEIHVAAGKSHFKLVAQEYTFRTGLLESRYPPYTKAIPRAQDKWVLVEKESLRRALSRMVILAHEKSRAVLLQLQPGLLTLIANNQEQEEAIESIEAQTEGTELKIGVLTPIPML